MLERRAQAKIVQTHGPQLPDERRQRRMNMIAVGDDRPARSRKLQQVRARPVTNADSIELDDIEILPELIVQLASEALSLGFLQPHILLRKAAVVSQAASSCASASLRRRNSRPALPIAARGEPGQAGRQHHQHSRNSSSWKRSQGAVQRRTPRRDRIARHRITMTAVASATTSRVLPDRSLRCTHDVEIFYYERRRRICSSRNR